MLFIYLFSKKKITFLFQKKLILSCTFTELFTVWELPGRLRCSECANILPFMFLPYFLLKNNDGFCG